MDYLRIKNISETDFDGIIQTAGGSRLAEGSALSADYRLHEAIIELKLIEEEGFEKTSRQAKIARIFRAQQPHAPVVVVDPTTLARAQSRYYYNVVAGPIKVQVKKADKQLEATAQRYSPQPTKVLVIINLGYTALEPDEFQSICLKCVHNDTTNIDFLVCGGIYFHSDKFDNYMFARFEPLAVNLARSFPSYEPMLNAWNHLVENVATSMLRDEQPPDQGRLPTIDLDFVRDGVRYVKPAPTVLSNFFPSGLAPRANSSGIDKCPPVAHVLPAFTRLDWDQFRRALPGEPTLKGSFEEYLMFQYQRDTEESTTLKPVVAVPITYNDFRAQTPAPRKCATFWDLCAFAAVRLETQIREVLARAREKNNVAVLPLQYMHLSLQVIGTDEANDLATLHLVCDMPGLRRKKAIFTNERLFLNYALAVAASYAVKHHVDFLLFSRTCTE
jgi:hypothetical protein